MAKNQQFEMKDVGKALEALFTTDAMSAVNYLAKDMIIRATWQGKQRRGSLRETIILTIGQPNYRERKFIKLCKRAKEKFPVRKIQLRPYPVKRKKSCKKRRK